MEHRFVAFHIVTGLPLHASPTVGGALGCARRRGLPSDSVEVVDAGSDRAGLDIVAGHRTLSSYRHLPIMHRATFYDHA